MLKHMGLLGLKKKLKSVEITFVLLAGQKQYVPFPAR